MSVGKMDSFEFNKMAGALLGTLLLTMGLGLFSDALFYHAPPAKPGFALPSGTEAAAAKPAAAKPEEPLPVLLSKADAKKGATLAKACATCHNFAKGAGPKVGPPLWDVVDRPVASIAGFDYSDALKKKGGKWTYDDIFHFIKNPKVYAPGTKMGFAGEEDAQKRADILAYLQTLADKPVPFPKPEAAPAKAAAPAADAKGNAAPVSNGTPKTPATAAPAATPPASATPAPAGAKPAPATPAPAAPAAPAAEKAAPASPAPAKPAAPAPAAH